MEKGPVLARCRRMHLIHVVHAHTDHKIGCHGIRIEKIIVHIIVVGIVIIITTTEKGIGEEGAVWTPETVVVGRYGTHVAQ